MSEYLWNNVSKMVMAYVQNCFLGVQNYPHHLII